MDMTAPVGVKIDFNLCADSDGQYLCEESRDVKSMIQAVGLI